MVESQLTNGQGLKAYRCLTRETQEGDGESEMSYTLNLPDSFINANKAKLDTGISNICILGGSAIRNDLSKPDFVVIPSRASITFVESSARHVRRLAQTGTRTTLIVRVTSSTESVPDSAVFLANAAFGVGGQPYSMSAQFNSCSAGKLNFVPASGFGIITNGVMELSLSATVVGVNIFDLENPMTIAVSALLGIPSLSAAFSNVIFCMPFGTTFLAGGSNQWFAYAYRPGKFSYYNNGKCMSVDESQTVRDPLLLSCIVKASVFLLLIFCHFLPKMHALVSVPKCMKLGECNYSNLVYLFQMQQLTVHTTNQS